MIMKDIKEIKFEELTTKQKLGFVTIATVHDRITEEQMDYIKRLIKEHAVGAIWVNTPSRVEELKAVADYPILVMCDAEEGYRYHKIGRQNALGIVDSEKAAYVFGKVTAIAARSEGYNVICNPILDMPQCRSVCGNNIRGIGSDKEQVARLAVAQVRGMHDGGILAVAKHYPGEGTDGKIDSHMAEELSMLTEEELVSYNLYPYLALMKEGLLDGIMTRHARFVNIDPDYPASLSEKVIGIIRKLGFDGFSITDALVMCGITAKFGTYRGVGLSVGNGNDIALAWNDDHREAYDSMCRCYEEGLISDERLDEAVKRILEAQHKTLAAPKFTEITDEDIREVDGINRDSVIAITDEGVPAALSRDGRHYFVILTETTVDINNRIEVDTFSKGWYSPLKIADKLKELYPNSEFTMIGQFPGPHENMRVLEKSQGYDDVVFVTFYVSRAYVGMERFTPRVISLMEALQVTNRISTVVHFGTPYVFEDLPHVPRIIIGTCSEPNTLYTLDVLSGDYPANGKMTNDVKFN